MKTSFFAAVLSIAFIANVNSASAHPFYHKCWHRHCGAVRVVVAPPPVYYAEPVYIAPPPMVRYHPVCHPYRCYPRPCYRRRYY